MTNDSLAAITADLPDSPPRACSFAVADGCALRADSIILLDHDQGDVLTGQPVNVMPFEGLN
ncbi:hypothetical protein ACFJGW_11705 [Burkholderiaceae bacterium UC74_6]